MADFLDEKRREIDSRLKELRPLVDEFNRLEKAAAALAGVGATTNGSSSTGQYAAGVQLWRLRPQGPRKLAREAAEHGQSRHWSSCEHDRA